MGTVGKTAKVTLALTLMFLITVSCKDTDGNKDTGEPLKGIFSSVTESLKYLYNTFRSDQDSRNTNESSNGGTRKPEFATASESHLENFAAKNECDFCFKGAKCYKNGTCYCDTKKGEYYHDNQCKKIKPEKRDCNLENYMKKCSCPRNTTRLWITDKCQPTSSKQCKEPKKECGYGICIEKGEVQSCTCFDFAELNSETGKCTLKERLCPTGMLQKDRMKCQCDGQYKQADDNTTCELKTCSDVMCKSPRICDMNWKGEGYVCKCPKDYEEGQNGECINLCNGIECFNGGKCNKTNGECDCKPDFKGNKCEIFPEKLCKDIKKNCIEKGGKCIGETKDKVNCTCNNKDHFYVENQGCKNLCNGIVCFNGGNCNKTNGECDCKPDFKGNKCEICMYILIVLK